MKMNFKTLLAVAVAAIAIPFVSCTKDENTTPSADTGKAGIIAAQFVEKTVKPTYTNLAAIADELVSKLQALKTSRTDANVTAACEVFLEARDWWEKSEAFLFGAATDFGIDPHIDSWPLDVDGFNNLMNSPAMLTSLAGDDGDVYAGDYLGNALLGFHGIEYILFANGNPKAATAITNDQLTYAIAVAGDLRNRCFQLEVSWLGDDAPAAHIEKVEDLELNSTLNGGLSYGENMRNAGNAGSSYATAIAALEAIIDGCRTIADEVGTSKIGAPYSGEDVNYIESPYSQKSVIDFYNNIISIQNVYMGGVEGNRDETNSLHAFVSSFNLSLDAEVVAAINNALAKINAMPKPFVNNITAAPNGEAI
ncbi:MAG: peptidase M75, partial [Bacteroidales bacterium]|nr:peptidase M75 [Bacteroidales bacterium]